MCGINLIIDRRKHLASDIVDLMADRTRHRGPDETKSLRIETTTKTYLLATNRLKITDQSDASSQPYISEDSKYALMFNGEIYNFYTLKNELINKNIRFTSHSDTEVLFHWLRIHGKNGLSKLEGMFAIVYMDFEKDEVLIARDRFGIKPFFYFEDENYFIASSEIKSIIATGLVKPELNTSQIQHYLLYKHAKQPETFFRHIYELGHGIVLIYKGNEWHVDRFYQNKRDRNGALPDLDEIEELITGSLIQQINVPVPLGLLLSGGIDSTLLLALAHKEGYSIPTFSIVNSKEDKSFGTKDYKYSRLAASTYATDHCEVEVDISLLEQFDHFVNVLDQPIGDSSYLMTSEICKKASGSMKILLSGAGADELFAGYNRHKAFYAYLRYKKYFDLLIPPLIPFLNSLPSGHPYPFRKKIKLLKKWSYAHHKSPWDTFHNYLVFNELKIERKNFYSAHKRNDQDWFSWALKHDQNHYLIADVLALSDKASMLHGIELRLPYLDEKLVTCVHQMQARHLVSKGQKWILKSILKKNGGSKFVNRPKEGFGLPLSNWLFDQTFSHHWELFQSQESLIFDYLETKIVDRLMTQQRRKTEDHGPLLWSILVLGHWLQRNFG